MNRPSPTADKLAEEPQGAVTEETQPPGSAGPAPTHRAPLPANSSRRGARGRAGPGPSAPPAAVRDGAAAVGGGWRKRVTAPAAAGTGHTATARGRPRAASAHSARQEGGSRAGARVSAWDGGQDQPPTAASRPPRHGCGGQRHATCAFPQNTPGFDSAADRSPGESIHRGNRPYSSAREVESWGHRAGAGGDGPAALLPASDMLQAPDAPCALSCTHGPPTPDLSSWQRGQAGCEKAEAIREKVDVQIRETLRLIFSGDEHDSSVDWLLQKLSAQFVSKDDVQVLLRDLELQILRNITHHISVTRQMPTSETIVSAVSGAGISGITEAQARVIVNNALKLYSQDKTGMVDFALESGGGSVLSTRCSETYETKTALISLFGVPLWYFSQSPRVAIQPDIYPGNCWAFRGSQGYLVVRLSMTIRPTAFTLEHIPKTLSPTGSITSAPKDFAVYGLENEYQEEGQLLGRFTYDQEGESLQMFVAPKKPERAFQIVELRIFSNWGHPEYTCLYRFRVHGEPVE
ncbi:TPA: sperm associated antigen 4-like [Bos taurus]|nr:TPA: sperm associated antigen 4-like [Bos taurus]